MNGHDKNNEPIIGYDKLVGESEPLFFLGHSCDEWVIGTIEQAKYFIHKLKEIVEAVEKDPNYRKADSSW